MHGPVHHPHHPLWGAGAPGVPEMVTEIQAGPGHPMAIDTLQGPLAYTNPNLDVYELQKLEQHRLHIQKLQQLEQNAAAAAAKSANPHDVSMTRSMSDHYAARPQLTHFHSEQQRSRQHPANNLALVIPSTPAGRLVPSAAPSPVSGTFPSPAAYP
ncbi:hypothetical protein BGZ65_012946, partial [Modicella reniformis]